MNWLAFFLVGGAAAWFEFNYQRSRRNGNRPANRQKKYPVPETAHVEQRDSTPSISPGSENDKKLNTTA